MHLPEQVVLNTVFEPYTLDAVQPTLLIVTRRVGGPTAIKPITVELLRPSTNQTKDILAGFTTPPVHM